ncbi:MAG: hypothetical protein KDE33_29125, partial [Bacteroidetes bacterium]|nr:hypothetical protein [Bacteroidota bacterium]
MNTTTYQRNMVIENIFSSHRCNGSDYRTVFSQRSNNYTCLDHPPPHVSGSLSENNMDALTVNFRLCNNKTENPKGIICKPPEVIKALIQSKMALVGSYDYYVDAKDYLNPIKPHFILQSPLSLDLNLIQNSVISLRSLQVIDDDSLILEAQNTKQGFKFAGFETHFVTVSDFSAQNTVANPFLRIGITSSPYNEKFSRRYQKIPDLLANISGVLSAILLFVGFLMNIFNEVKLRKYVANALYIIHDISGSKKAKEKKTDYITTLAAKINPTQSGLMSSEKMNFTRKDVEQNIELNSNTL